MARAGRVLVIQVARQFTSWMPSQRLMRIWNEQLRTRQFRPPFSTLIVDKFVHDAGIGTSLLAFHRFAPLTGSSTPIRIAKLWESTLSCKTSEMLNCAAKLLRRSNTHSAIDRVHGAFRSLRHGRVRTGRCALRDPMDSNARTVWRVRQVSISRKRSAD